MFTDWFAYFWPQISDPMVVKPGMFNLPWLFILLQPLRLLGPYMSLALVEIVTVGVVFQLTRLLNLSAQKTVFVLFSPPVLWCLFMGQMDGVILLAYLVPPGWAMFLALCKPQAAFGAGLEAFRRYRWSALVAAVLLLSAWVLWKWPFSMQNPPSFFSLTFLDLTSWNWSLWPLGLVLIPLLKSPGRRTGLWISPFLFPYAGLQSLIGPVLAAAKLPWKYFIPIWVLLWIRWALMVRLIVLPGF
jgi:hypothetical protein